MEIEKIEDWIVDVEDPGKIAVAFTKFQISWIPPNDSPINILYCWRMAGFKFGNALQDYDYPHGRC